MDEAERCSRVAYLYLSRLLAEGSPEELLSLPEATPSGMRRVEAVCPRGAAPMMHDARRLAYVEESTIFGNALHLLLREDVNDEQLRRTCSSVRSTPTSDRCSPVTGSAA